MPVLMQKWIYRSDLQSNQSVIYLFGDNTVRVGMGGQAKEMRGEPNAYGIATKRLPSQMPNSYFSDDDFDEVTAIMDSDLKPIAPFLRNGGIVVLPSDGLGTGLSELPQRCPRLNTFLEERLESLKLIR